MEQLALTFFPYPHVFRGERREGAVTSWPDPCLSCNRQCESSHETGLRICSYGVNYQRVDPDLLVAGIVVSDYPTARTGARQKVLRQVRAERITRAQLEKTLAKGVEATAALERELQSRRDQIIADYRESEKYQTDVVGLLRPDLERTLAQVHDYKQFVQQIIQNLDVLLEMRFPGESIEEKLDKAHHEEVAIYWSARLMDEKLDAALFLLYPERIHELRERGRFRFHGLVTKYRKIYERQIDAKQLKVATLGDSFSDVEGNSRAIAIIPHAFIDNAVKYAPAGTKIVLAFEESDELIRFAVESYGPPVLEEERDHIFDLFVRGSEAQRRHSEGTGFGLASAQNVATALGLQLSFDQKQDRRGPNDTRWTIFGVTLPRNGARRNGSREMQRPARRKGRRNAQRV